MEKTTLILSFRLTSGRLPMVFFGFVLLATCINSNTALAQQAQAELGHLQLTILDEGGERLACRVHLRDSQDHPVQAPGLPFFRDHFVCDSPVQLQLMSGEYHYEIERGCEYEPIAGSVRVDPGQKHAVEVTLQRIAHASEKGWFSGDLHIHRSLQDIRLLMRAEDLHVAPVITWWNDNNHWTTETIPKDGTVQHFDGDRFINVMAGEDEREGGALMYFGLTMPLAISGASREYPSPLKFVDQADQQNPNVWLDIEKPFWWDVPAWIASGRMDSVGLANNHMCRNKMYEDEAWGFPRDERKLRAPRGNGYWTQEIYYHLLNTGNRLPPSAGSASGVLPNPVGYNRVYVHCDGELTYHKWWQNLRAGRCFVTNGPILYCHANGQLPGHVFQHAKQLDLKLDLSLLSNDAVRDIEIIRDGKVVKTISLADKHRAHNTANLSFQKSGWFLARAITTVPHTFRFASTGPFYVEIGEKSQRISRHSAQFFLDWAQQRRKRIIKAMSDPREREEVVRYHDRAIRYWQEKCDLANVE
jgi:hypothetical protein